jgi:hypothetical protein
MTDDMFPGEYVRCEACGNGFTERVWHCETCGAHWGLDVFECRVCHGDEDADLETEKRRWSEAFENAQATLADVAMQEATQGRKDDSGKARFDLLPPDAMDELVRVYTTGAQRYGERNWERGILYGRVFAAAMRHLWAWWRGERLDTESGLPHLAHAAWNCMTLLAYEVRGMDDYDDRPDYY